MGKEFPRSPNRNEQRREIALQRRAYKISVDEYAAILNNIPMKSTINTNIAPYDFVGHPKSTKNKTIKKLVLPVIKIKK